MDSASFVASVLAAVAIVLIPYLLYRVARWARARTKGAYVLGMAIAPFAAGNVVDPDFRAVNEAKQDKKREEDDAGDPPNDEQEARSRGPAEPS